MKNTKNTTNKIGVISKVNTLKINQKKIYAKKNSKNSITPRQTNITKSSINTNSNNKITVNMINNNEENINHNNLLQKQKPDNRTSKSREKILNENGVIKKSNTMKKVLTVNKSYNTIAKNKNKKNEKNNNNVLINSLLISQNDNKGYMTTTSTCNNMNSDINSSKRDRRSKSKTMTKKKSIGDIKSFSDENNKNKEKGGNTTTKKCIKKTKSNTNIKINLNSNFNNIINQNNINVNTKKIIVNNNELEKSKQNININVNKSGDNLNKGKNIKNPEINKKEGVNKNKKTINNIRKESLDIKKKYRNSKSSKKLTIKTLPKKNNNVEENAENAENADNKSISTINNSKNQIVMGRPSVNELFYNSINNTKSIQILSPIKQKPKKPLTKNKNTINLMGSYNIKKNNLLNLKNNNNNTNNLKKKNSTIFHDKNPKINNQNKKNKKIINNNNIETNNTTGTLGTIIMNKEEANASKALDNKTIKAKSSKDLKSNPVNSITDSIESKNINTSNCNNKVNIKNNKNISNSKKTLNVNIHIENYDDNAFNENSDNKEKDNNEPISKNTDNYYQLLDISPDTPTSSYKKLNGMNKKTKSVSHMHITKKKENNEILKKNPLSKKSLNGPKLNDKIIIKFEDLLEFETKLDNIITSLSNTDNINEGGATNECNEFMSFYFHSSLCGIFINFFNPKNKIIIYSGNNLLLLSIVIAYHLSINPKMLTNLIDDMKYIFSLLKINYLLLIKKIELYYDDEFPMKYIDILNQKLGQVKTTNCSNEIDIISKINKNCCNISERLKLILNYYQRNNDKSYNEFNGIFKNISTVSEKNINSYFYNYLYINPLDFAENNKINNINNINNNYNNNVCKNFSRMDSSISSISNSSIKGYDDNDSDNFNDNMSYKTEKSEDNEREIRSVKSYKSTNYYGKLKSNNIGSTINCDNNFYYNIENNIYENDEDGTNAYEIMQMLKNYEINKVDAPFLVTPSKKKFTLVLDLDETLIHLRQKKDVINIKNDVNIKINNKSDYFYDNYDKNNNKYLLQFRVGLFSFLTILKPFYELISFTSASKEYADVIINEIEKKRKFFDHKFYREHCVIYKDTFVKDISRIGRDIKKIIIIDNNERNFVLNKENGIKIAPYYGDEDNSSNNNNNIINNSINSDNNGRLSHRGKKGNDNVLLELKKILVMIYKDNYDDLREALKDYEDLISSKVSLNFINKGI